MRLTSTVVYVHPRCVEAKATGVEALRASPDGRWLAVARSNGTLEIYESSTDFLKLVSKADIKKRINHLSEQDREAEWLASP